MTNKLKIYEQGTEKYSKACIFFGNFIMLLWIAAGTISCWFLSPIAAWIYLVFAIIMIGIVLRKIVCKNCYYYDKLCCYGWGKLSALLFKKGKIEDFSKSLGIKVAPITYGLLTLIPLVLIIISLFQEFTVLKIVVLIFLLLVSFYSGAINRKKTCALCKMRFICPGCAVKK